MKYLHEYTFPELLTTEETVIDWTGIMWVGKDRKGINAPNPTDLWKAWQKDVQKAGDKAGVVTPEVMGYFQATKGFSRPPKDGEINEHLFGGLIRPPEKTQAVAVPPFRFTWSFSQLNQFATCPFQWAEERFYHMIPRQETKQTLWGTEVHTAFEDYVNSNGQKVAPLENFMGGLKYAQGLVKAKERGAKVLCEFKMALNRKLQPVDFDSPEAWARGIADIVIINGNVARIWDWKTGRQKDDNLQLLIFCAFLAQHFPELDEFQAEFVWLKTDTKVGMPRPIQRRELLEVWKRILSMVKRMEDMIATETFLKQPNGLCKEWCFARRCPHCGRK